MKLAGMALSHTKAKKSKAKMMSMMVKPGASGGYIAEHHHDDGSMKSHAIPNMQALHKHMEEHLPEEAMESGY